MKPLSPGDSDLQERLRLFEKYLDDKYQRANDVLEENANRLDRRPILKAERAEVAIIRSEFKRLFDRGLSKAVITHDEAAVLANAHVRDSNSRIAAVYAWQEIPGSRPNIYWTSATPLEDCWVAYLESEGFAINSSTIVVIDPIDGAVLYFGSAGDEG